MKIINSIRGVVPIIHPPPNPQPPSPWKLVVGSVLNSTLLTTAKHLGLTYSSAFLETVGT